MTDANLLLGVLAPDSRLAGDIELDLDAAAAAVGALASSLGLGETETAEGIVRIANQEMVRALRVVTVERGIDPRAFALLPFGGAGPMHAVALAEELGIGRVLCPRSGGVLSALGLCASDRRRDTTRTVMLAGPDLATDRIAAEVEELVAAAGGDAGAETEIVFEMRYSGQAFELPVPGDAHPDPEELRSRFERAHQDRFGHTDPDAEVVLVQIRLALVTTGPRPRPVAPAAPELVELSRRVRFGGEGVETPVLRGEPAAGFAAAGPVVFELPEATFLVPPGWATQVDDAGTIVAARGSE